MANNEPSIRRGVTPRPRWAALSGAGALALVLAVAVGSGMLWPGAALVATAQPSTGPIPTLAPAATDAPAPTDVPAPTGGPISGGGMAMCAFMYDLETLQDREWAFDGTLIALDGNQGTFRVDRWFKGGDGESATVTVDGMTAESGLLGGPGLVVDGRYLVTGDDEFAWSCGFTQYWIEATAADWARVLGG